MITKSDPISVIGPAGPRKRKKLKTAIAIKNTNMQREIKIIFLVTERLL
jgi:hypothetical protein